MCPIGAQYGWPWVYWKDMIDERVEGADAEFLTEYTRKPEYALGPHVAALGLAFTQGGTRWATKFAHGAFIARHGSWNRKPPSGYDVVFVRFDDRGNPTGMPVPVLKGFLAGDGKTHGRPTWVTWDKTGALLVSDDTAGIVWRVTAPGATPAAAHKQATSDSLPPQRELNADPADAFEDPPADIQPGMARRTDPRRSAERLACASGQLDYIMPGDAARTGAAPLGPFERVGLVPCERVLGGIAADDVEVFVLRAGVEAERQPEAIGQRQPVVDHVARIDRIVLFGHLPGDDRSAVRGHRQPDIGRARLDPAFEPAAQVPRTVACRPRRSPDRRHRPGSCARAAPSAANSDGSVSSASVPTWTSASRCRHRAPCAAMTAARTSADLPIPRAPHSSMSCAACPAASRSTFSRTASFCRSMPLSSASGGASIRAIGRAALPAHR